MGLRDWFSSTASSVKKRTVSGGKLLWKYVQKWVIDYFPLFFLTLTVQVTPLAWKWLGLVFVVLIVAASAWVGEHAQMPQTNTHIVQLRVTPFFNTFILFVWTIASSLTVVYFHIDAPRKYWTMAGLCLAAALTMETFRKYEHIPTTPKEDSGPLWQRLFLVSKIVANHLYEASAIGFVVAAGYLYAKMDSTPWGVPWALFVPPMAYVIYRIMVRNENNRVHATYFTFMLTCLLLVSIWPGDYAPVPPKVTCPANRNIGMCGGSFLGERVDAYPGCCCQTYHFLFDPYNRCTQCQALNSKNEDCCGNKITSDNEHLLGGEYQCVCSQRPDDKRNKVENGHCMCHEPGTCGLTCEFNTEGACGNTSPPPSTNVCHNIEKSRPGSKCLYIG